MKIQNNLTHDNVVFMSKCSTARKTINGIF